MLIRLTALQQFQQSSHLAIPDEFLNFFLSDSSTVGAGSDADLRRRVRREARSRVGFDPYDESPIKRRGEEYQRHDADAVSPEEHVAYDYEGYPSRSSTPARSPSIARSTVEGWHENRAPNLSSPSPLLRRATTQPQFRNQSFQRPPTAPHTSSSPRFNNTDAGGGTEAFRGVDTPPSSTGK
jgi:hypothetical protein